MDKLELLEIALAIYAIGPVDTNLIASLLIAYLLLDSNDKRDRRG